MPRGKKTTLRGAVVKEYLDQFPKTKHLTLAKKIFKETGVVFDDVEQVRTLIRYYTGSQGENNRKGIADRRFMRDSTIDNGKNPYELPESDAKDYPIFKIPKAQNRILVIGDIHVPYQDNKAVTATIDWGKDHDVNTIYFNGDIIDNHQLSYFMKDPRKKKFVEERDVLWKFLDTFQEQLPDAVIYYKAGNHEERFENYLMTHAPAIFDTEEYHFDILMRLGERSITYIGDKIRVKAGKLSILHGHEFRGGNPNIVNPARYVFTKAKESTMVNHFHQTSEHSEPTLSGDIITCFSVGALCGLNPEWNPLNKWNHGFARVVVEPDDNYKVFNARIYEGRVL